MDDLDDHGGGGGVDVGGGEGDRIRNAIEEGQGRPREA